MKVEIGIEVLVQVKASPSLTPNATDNIGQCPLFSKAFRNSIWRHNIQKCVKFSVIKKKLFICKRVSRWSLSAHWVNCVEICRIIKYKMI